MNKKKIACDCIHKLTELGGVGMFSTKYVYIVWETVASTSQIQHNKH